MENFQIVFEYPWTLLLLIPAVFLTLFPYFRIARKYRRTRNRIISVVMHMLVMVLSIFVLSGVSFHYDKPNMNNEMIVLVDMSFSNEQTSEDKDLFVKDIIEMSEDVCKVGVVTFGYDQVYAAPLSDNYDEVYEQYLRARLPDTSGTDIASALLYTRGLFSHEGISKVVLLSDGEQTDNNALDVIAMLAADKVKVSTVCFPNDRSIIKETQLVSVNIPDDNIKPKQTFKIALSARSSVACDAVLKAYDNDKQFYSESIVMSQGYRDINIDHSFADEGLHILKFVISSKEDGIEENNTIYTYCNIELYDKILLVERTEGESANFVEALVSQEDVKAENITVMTIDSDELPKDVNTLRNYDEVILMNIGNQDMPEGFIENLEIYVSVHGGGMLTIGGNRGYDEDGDPINNVYDRNYMRGSLYQQMLPVEAVDFTPPLGVILVIDRSGSMSGVGSDGRSRLEAAKQGAISALSVLSERDYVGVLTLDDTVHVDQLMIPCTQKAKILDTILNVEGGGGTEYTGALERAGTILAGSTLFEKRHIILISDAQPGDKIAEYGKVITDNYKRGITTTIVTLGTDSDADMIAAANMGGGSAIFLNDSEIETVANYLRDDLRTPQITDISKDPFVPQIGDRTTINADILQENIPQLYGYYGVKLKKEESVVQPLKSTFVPIYAQWKYGKGRVGSFMCDLYGTPESWSYEFINDSTGRRLIRNIVYDLFPSTNIDANEIDAEFNQYNYKTDLSIFTDFGQNDRITLEIEGPSQKAGQSDLQTVKIEPTKNEGYTRIKYEMREPGVYKVTINKLRKQGDSEEIIATYSTYRVFSYSREYDMFVDSADGIALLKALAQQGGSNFVDKANPRDVFNDIREAMHREHDPRYWMLILAIIFFLIDIAVRKFKFKWIHEIIRERKEKKQMNDGQ